MSHSHIKQTVLDLKEKVKKNLPEIETSQELVADMLEALRTTDVDAELLSATGIGNVVNEARSIAKEKKIDQVYEKASALLESWRKIAKNPSTSSKARRAADASNAAVAAAAQKPTDFAADNASRKRALSSDRKNTVGSIVRVLQKNHVSGKADQMEHFALDIEEAVHEVANYASQRAKYTEKIKSIVFNLTKNEALRNALFDGELAASRLATMSASELASKELREARERVNHEEVMARRLDGDELYRKEIQAELGIDPEQWQYERGDDEMSEPDMDAPDV